ncbi:MAG TPA: polyprenol monophosphomannose synthase [Chloroflexota bacterium]
MIKVVVVIPTYNEADNLPRLVDELLALERGGRNATHLAEAMAEARQHAPPVPSSGEPIRLAPDWSDGKLHIEVLVVDDSSPDGTAEVALGLAQRYPGRIHLLRRPAKLGLGTAYIDGFRRALTLDPDVVVEMDADFSHSPTYIPVFVDVLRQADVVVGSRWVRGGKLDPRWGRWRRLLSRVANWYARLVTGLPVHDTTAGFKAFRRSALEAIDLTRIRSDGYAFQIEMAVACHRKGLRVVELPIFFEERGRGKSKMSWRIILEAFWRVWELRFRY